MTIEGTEGPYEPEETKEDPFGSYQRVGETLYNYAQRLAIELHDCRAKVDSAELRAITAERNLRLAKFTADENVRQEQFWASFKISTEASPFIRQHNEISKMVADLLKEPPGPGKALVRFLAATLDMELPEQWRESQI